MATLHESIEFNVMNFSQFSPASSSNNRVQRARNAQHTEVGHIPDEILFRMDLIIVLLIALVVSVNTSRY